MTQSGFQSSVKKFVLRCIKCSLGLDVVRSRTRYDYYPFHWSCQIPLLSKRIESILGARQKGYFVDVGGYDGKTFSNTWGLAQRGWHGIVIEPVPVHADEARFTHRSHPGVEVVQVAVAASPGSTELYISGPYTSSQRESAQRSGQGDLDRLEVNSDRLDSLLEAKGAPRRFDLLSVDVEGAEAEVFGSFSLEEWRPQVIILEAHDFHLDVTVRQREASNLVNDVCQAGYLVAYKDDINVLFVARELQFST